MMKTTCLTALIVCSFVGVAQAAVVNTSVTSSNFSIGRGKTAGNLTAQPWTENGLNIGPGAGFTLSVNVVGATFSGAGPVFPGSVLTTGLVTDGIGSQDGFLATITATASTQPDAALLPNYMTSLNLSQISVWAAKHASYSPANPGLVETTVGHTGASDLITNLNSGSGNAYVQSAASYKQLIWDLADADPLDSFQVAGLSVTRTFALVPTFNGSNYYLVDGFEVLGNISVSFDVELPPAPEPSSALMGLMVVAFVSRIRRRKPVRS